MFRKLMHSSRIISKLRVKLLPLVCILCGQSTKASTMLCNACQSDLPILADSCQICAQFLTATPGIERICGSCLQEKPAYAKVYALFPYQFPISNLIIRLKFRHELCIANTVGKLLSQRIQSEWYKDKPLPQLIIPIPLHTMRLRERGFNQALEIAKIIAKTLSIPMDCHGSKRTKATVAQSGLSAAKRKLNVANAFSITRDYSDFSIAVVDDVITTGHTINAFCKQLRQQGAKDIDVWCGARR